ncbi:unnamed protein product, partial [Polarella glacialis]
MMAALWSPVLGHPAVPPVAAQTRTSVHRPPSLTEHEASSTRDGAVVAAALLAVAGARASSRRAGHRGTKGLWGVCLCGHARPLRCSVVATDLLAQPDDAE